MTCVVINAQVTSVVGLCAYTSSKFNGIVGLKRKKTIVDFQKLYFLEVFIAIMP